MKYIFFQDDPDYLETIIIAEADTLEDALANNDIPDTYLFLTLEQLAEEWDFRLLAQSIDESSN